MMRVDPALARTFYEEAKKAFSFLVEKHSFGDPVLTIDEAIGFAIVTFMGKNLAIECLLEEREADIDCEVARVIDGKKTLHYQCDDRGNLVRDGVYLLLLRRGIRAKLFTKVTGLSLREKIPIILSDFARMLQQYGRDILEDSPTALSADSGE